MTIAEREKKLAFAEKALKRTQTRIKRLQTAEHRWMTRVTYYRRALSLQRAEHMAAQGQGRMFRRPN